jgi:hypothetical protein
MEGLDGSLPKSSCFSGTSVSRASEIMGWAKPERIIKVEDNEFRKGPAIR